MISRLMAFLILWLVSAQSPVAFAAPDWWQYDMGNGSTWSRNEGFSNPSLDAKRNAPVEPYFAQLIKLDDLDQNTIENLYNLRDSLIGKFGTPEAYQIISTHLVPFLKSTFPTMVTFEIETMSKNFATQELPFIKSSPTDFAPLKALIYKSVFALQLDRQGVKSSMILDQDPYHSVLLFLAKDIPFDFLTESERVPLAEYVQTHWKTADPKSLTLQHFYQKALEANHPSLEYIAFMQSLYNQLEPENFEKGYQILKDSNLQMERIETFETQEMAQAQRQLNENLASWLIDTFGYTSLQYALALAEALSSSQSYKQFVHSIFVHSETAIMKHQVRWNHDPQLTALNHLVQQISSLHIQAEALAPQLRALLKNSFSLSDDDVSESLPPSDDKPAPFIELNALLSQIAQDRLENDQMILKIPQAIIPGDSHDLDNLQLQAVIAISESEASTQDEINGRFTPEILEEGYKILLAGRKQLSQIDAFDYKAQDKAKDHIIYDIIYWMQPLFPRIRIELSTNERNSILDRDSYRGFVGSVLIANDEIWTELMSQNEVQGFQIPKHLMGPDSHPLDNPSAKDDTEVAPSGSKNTGDLLAEAVASLSDPEPPLPPSHDDNGDIELLGGSRCGLDDK